MPQGHSSDSTERATFRPLHRQHRVPFCFLFTLQELLQLQRFLYDYVNRFALGSVRFVLLHKKICKICKISDSFRTAFYAQQWCTQRDTAF